MTKLQFPSRRAECQGQELVTEADSKGWHLSGDLLKCRNDGVNHSRIARAIRDEQPIRAKRANVRRRRGMRKEPHFTSALAEMPIYVSLRTTVDGSNLESRCLRSGLNPAWAPFAERFVPTACASWTYRRCEIRSCHRWNRLRAMHECTVACSRIGRQDATHRATHAQSPNERSGVHTCDGWDGVPLEPTRQPLNRAIVGRGLDQLAHDETRDAGAGTFKISLRNPVVSDLRHRQGQNLPGVGKVRQRLLIPHHRSVKHDFTRTFDAAREQSTERKTVKNRPVFKSKTSWDLRNRAGFGLSSRREHCDDDRASLLKRCRIVRTLAHSLNALELDSMPPITDSLFQTATADANPSAGFALVAIERGMDHAPDGLTYAIPTALAHLPEGARVLVPLGRGNRPTAGWIVRKEADLAAFNGAALDPSKLKSILAKDDSEAVLPSELLALARWVSGYYACPIGMTLASVLPGAVRKQIGRVTRVFYELATPTDTDAPPNLTKRQREALDVIRGMELPAEQTALLQATGLSSPQTLKRLVALGHLRASQRTAVEATWSMSAVGSVAEVRPTPAQQQIVEDIAKTFATFSQHLLFGVTGSGKTEVYIRLIQRCLSLGKKAMLLVPEIALTPQTAGRIVARFPDSRVAILHSGLTASQRNLMWSLASDGLADVIVGARSAVFAPIPDASLGLVIVDEEHETGYKQDSAPRYHGRDCAIRRAQLAKCPVVLGSATPSLESWWNATKRKTTVLHRLPERAPGLRIPKVSIVDFAAERREFRDRKVHLIGPTLERAMRDTLAARGQVLLLLNRRGYANYIACADQRCGWTAQCSECDAGMICHQDRIASLQWVRCHHCQAEQQLPRNCPQCGKVVTVFGLGTQRVEEELLRLFPSLEEDKSLVRVDGDTMQTAKHFHDCLARFASGEISVLMGTQMIAKGLDFPNVQLVGVVSADTALSLPDFRAGERTFQLVNQVSGRCGRGAEAGRAIVQTFFPDNPAIRLAAAHDFESFANQETQDRVEFGLPPARRLARLTMRDASESKAQDGALQLANELRAIAAQAKQPAEIRGPQAARVARVSGAYRFEIEVQHDNAAEISRILAAARSAGLLPLGEHLAVDVDPVS